MFIVPYTLPKIVSPIPLHQNFVKGNLSSKFSYLSRHRHKVFSLIRSGVRNYLIVVPFIISALVLLLIYDMIFKKRKDEQEDSSSINAEEPDNLDSPVYENLANNASIATTSQESIAVVDISHNLRDLPGTPTNSFEDSESQQETQERTRLALHKTGQELSEGEIEAILAYQYVSRRSSEDLDDLDATIQENLSHNMGIDTETASISVQDDTAQTIGDISYNLRDRTEAPTNSLEDSEIQQEMQERTRLAFHKTGKDPLSAREREDLLTYRSVSRRSSEDLDDLDATIFESLSGIDAETASISVQNDTGQTVGDISYNTKSCTDSRSSSEDLDDLDATIFESLSGIDAETASISVQNDTGQTVGDISYNLRDRAEAPTNSLEDSENRQIENANTSQNIARRSLTEASTSAQYDTEEEDIEKLEYTFYDIKVKSSANWHLLPVYIHTGEPVPPRERSNPKGKTRFVHINIEESHPEILDRHVEQYTDSEDNQ